VGETLSTFDKMIEQEGGVQNGGIYLVTKEGGAMPTKFKSLYEADKVDVTELLQVMNAINHNPKLPTNISLKNVVNSITAVATQVVVTMNEEKPQNKEESKSSTVSNSIPDTIECGLHNLHTTKDKKFIRRATKEDKDKYEYDEEWHNNDSK